jgi:hypothetical protein
MIKKKKKVNRRGQSITKEAKASLISWDCQVNVCKMLQPLPFTFRTFCKARVVWEAALRMYCQL